MSTTTKPTALFLGGTGGTVLSALTHTLRSNYQVVALVRTPSKLTSLLTGQGLDTNLLSSNLHIIKGTITDLSAVKEALTTRQQSGTVTPLIICGIGAYPHFQLSLRQPLTLATPTVCADTITTIFTALDEIKPTNKAILTFLSTTGVNLPNTPADLPLLIRPLYHYLGSSPHGDKRASELLLTSDIASSSPHLKNFVIVRPALLTGDGTETTKRKIRVGTEMKPELGYSISRADVGEWIFREVVQGLEFDAEGKGWRCKWEGEKVTLTS